MAAILDKFVAFIAGFSTEAGKWIGMIVDFIKGFLPAEEPEEPIEIIE